MWNIVEQITCNYNLNYVIIKELFCNVDCTYTLNKLFYDIIHISCKISLKKNFKNLTIIHNGNLIVVDLIVIIWSRTNGW